MNRTEPHIPGVADTAEPRTAAGFFMDRALELAWLGAGRTLSNPMVGAVVEKDGQIVGEGYHAAYGLDHAETVALEQAGERAKGGTMYVTLEPCTHQGKTPPCVASIIGSGVSRVVISTLDPDPRTDGNGVKSLRTHGIEVDVGFRAERAIALNLPYLKQRMNMGSAVTLKMASTLDGRIASRPGARDQITGSDAAIFVHRLRADHEGVLVGINTLLVDQPRLDCRRLDDVDTPVPIVMDSALRFPTDYPWCDEGRRFIVISGSRASGDRIDELEKAGASVICCPSKDGTPEPQAAVDALASCGVSSVLVEGGAEVLTSFLEDGGWDCIRIFFSPRTFGPDGVALVRRRVNAGELVLTDVASFGVDVLATYLNRRTRDAMFDRLLDRR